MGSALSYLIKSKGLCLESAYLYTTKEGQCKRVDWGPLYDPISSFIDAHPQDENALMEVVAKQPLSIAIEADQSAFQFYSGGVMRGNCGHTLDHGVILVGYGERRGRPIGRSRILGDLHGEIRVTSF